MENEKISESISIDNLILKKSSEKEFAAKFEPQAKLLTALLKEADRDGKICKRTNIAKCV